MHDVIVVGAGPAGAATAITCARAGLDTIVLERSWSCPDKPGETLHPGTEPILDQLGVGDAVRAAEFLRHEGIDITWGTNQGFERYGSDAGGPWRGIQAWRSTLERLLLEAVSINGGSVHRGVKVLDARPSGHCSATLDTDLGPIQARWVVDASGGHHWLGRRLGLELRRLTPKLICWYGYVQRKSGDPPSLRGDVSGWTWSAEVRSGVYQWTRLGFGNARPRSVPVDGAVIGRTRAADVTWRWFPRCAGPGYFLVGDAASVFDPTSSHGVLRALMTGIKAGSLLVAAAKDGRLGGMAIREYCTWLGAWVRHEETGMRDAYRQLGADCLLSQ